MLWRSFQPLLILLYVFLEEWISYHRVKLFRWKQPNMYVFSILSFLDGFIERLSLLSFFSSLFFLQASEVQMHESQSDPAGHTIQAIHIESRNPSENESRVKSSQTSPPEVAGVSRPHGRSFSPSELALQITTRDASIRPTPIQIIFICWFTYWCILSFDTLALGKQTSGFQYSTWWSLIRADSEKKKVKFQSSWLIGIFILKKYIFCRSFLEISNTSSSKKCSLRCFLQMPRSVFLVWFPHLFKVWLADSSFHPILILELKLKGAAFFFL